MAAFDAMVNSDNPSIAELAITTAHASADEAMQALAVRAAFKAVKVFHVELTLPEHLTSNQKVFCVAAVDIPNVSFDYRRGAFENPGNPNNQGHVSGLTITFQTNQPCSGVLKQKEGTWQFEGKVSCPSGCGLTITGRASLR